MKKIIISILIVITAELLAYLIVSYAYYDFNPAHWSSIDRGFSSILSGMVGLLVAGGYISHSIENDKS